MIEKTYNALVTRTCTTYPHHLLPLVDHHCVIKKHSDASCKLPERGRQAVQSGGIWGCLTAHLT